MNIKFYQADCGDAARIYYIGSDNKPHNIFIDSGFGRTFRHVLADEIQSIIDSGEMIEAWLISHIHDDHIGGALAYIKAIRNLEFSDIIKNWIFNSPRNSNSAKIKTSLKPEVSDAKSIRQGDHLAEYLNSVDKIPVNDYTLSSSSINIAGLQIYILSPDFDGLKKLRTKYKDKNKPLERIENESVSKATAITYNDYHIPLNNFDLDKIDEDESIENLSCISVITEIHNKKILWLADANPSVVINSLHQLGYSDNNRLKCDIVKVAHHGSSNNNTKDLYDIIECDTFVISANGENKFYLPNKKCIATILNNKNRNPKSHYKIYFTHDNRTLRKIFEIDDKQIFSQLNFSVHYPTKSKKLEFNL